MTKDTHDTAALFLYHGDRIILQRRDAKAPTSPNLLGLFGGHIQKGEKPYQAAIRELQEETSIKLDEVDLELVATIESVWQNEHEYIARAYIFASPLAEEHFKVFEGKGMEEYKLSEVLDRDDLSSSSRSIIEAYLMEKDNGARRN